MQPKMHKYWIDKKIKYDGTQLKSLFAYMNYKLLGDSIVSWRGECDISFEHMVDGEDLLEKSTICGFDMTHFIIEKFDVNLFAAVSLQRLMASLVIDVICKMSHMSIAKELTRDGDDIFYKKKKLSISVATVSPVSTMIHFAVNNSNEGTPVETLSLRDLEIDPHNFSQNVMDKFEREVTTITQATQKVFWVK